MDAATIESRRDALVREHGPWSAYNIHLGRGVYTMGDSRVGVSEFLVQSLTQAIADVVGRPLSGLRILDLACHEGGYAVELGLRGAEVLGIEGRAANVEKARFAAQALGLDRVSFEQGDVRALSEEAVGRFDVVLCLGILYHLEAADAIRLIERCHSMCERMLVVRSAVGLVPDFDQRVAGHRYRGRRYHEDTHERAASLDNPVSILPTRASLLNLLADVGFSSVLEVRNPAVPGLVDIRDSVSLIALRGEPAPSQSLPELDRLPGEFRWPQRRGPSWIYSAAHPQQGFYWRVRERLLHSVRNTVWMSRRTVEEWRSARR